MSKPTSVDEDLDHIISYQEKFGCTDYIFSDSKKPLAQYIEDCIVVLDTNVLLIPYTLRNEDVAEIEKVYLSLSIKDQLLLPKHVAREFAANKDSKLSELYKTVCDRNVTVLKMPDAEILKDTSEFKSLEKERKKLEVVAATYNKAVKNLAKNIKEWSWNDPVVQMYSNFFNENTLVHHEKQLKGSEPFKENIMLRIFAQKELCPAPLNPIFAAKKQETRPDPYLLQPLLCPYFIV